SLYRAVRPTGWDLPRTMLEKLTHANGLRWKFQSGSSAPALDTYVTPLLRSWYGSTPVPRPRGFRPPCHRHGPISPRGRRGRGSHVVVGGARAAASPDTDRGRESRCISGARRRP